MASDNEQIIRRAYQVAEDKDLAAGSAPSPRTAPSPTSPSASPTAGPRELPLTVETYARAFPDMHRELYRFYVSGDIVEVQLALQGTHLGPLSTPLGTLPATGRRMDAPCCDVFKLAGGKIRRFDCYPSGTVIFSQLGVLESVAAVAQP